jgi:cupin 2 domain-containing protein
MDIRKNNIFGITHELPSKFEIFESLTSNEDISIERIISTGQKTPPGKWLEEDIDEWVMLLQGTAEIRFGDDTIIELVKGDYILIPANTRHRVEHTSAEPPCIWIAVHGKLR